MELENVISGAVRNNGVCGVPAVVSVEFFDFYGVPKCIGSVLECVCGCGFELADVFTMFSEEYERVAFVVGLGMDGVVGWEFFDECFEDPVYERLVWGGRSIETAVQ